MTQRARRGARAMAWIVVITIVAAVASSEAVSQAQGLAVNRPGTSVVLLLATLLVAFACGFLILTIIYMMDREAGRLSRRWRIFERVLEEQNER